MTSKYISNHVLIELLEKATEEERLSLTKILNEYHKKPHSPKELQDRMCREGGNFFKNMYRGEGTSYLDIVDDVLNKLEIEGFPSYFLEVSNFDEISSIRDDAVKLREKGVDYAEQAEEKIILKILEQVYEGMSGKEKATFDKQMNDVAVIYDSNTAKNLSGATGLMVLGNLGGFATYTFLTSIMSTLSLGALGFGAYTAATSLLSLMLGPVGWMGLSAFAMYKMGGGDYQKLIPCVAIIGAIRQRVKYDDCHIHT